MQVAQDEVDRVIGAGPVTVEYMSQLPYVSACLREVLRLYPSATGFQVVPNAQDYPIHIGTKKYQIQKGDIIRANLLKIHRDPLIYGDDSETFKPERMLDEHFNKLPPNSWKAGIPVRNIINASLPQDSHSETVLERALAKHLPGKRAMLL